MEEYLRLDVNHHQDDWTDWLALCEFAANNAASETTQVSPSYATFRRDPGMNFDLDQPIENPEQARVQEAVANLRKIHDLVRAEMTAAQFWYSEAYDKARRPAPKFEPGDQIWLDARHIKTTRPARKLDWKKLGPFPVKCAIGSNAYELGFPADIKVHPVQPISLLFPVAEHPLPGQIVPPPPPVEVKGKEPEYHVEAMEDSREFRGTLQYRVRWVGWPSLTWEPWYFVNTTDAITRFHKRYPKKPGPMPEGSEVAMLQRRGLSISGFAGAQLLRGGYCHGPSLDDEKAQATGDGSSLDDKTPVTRPTATSIAKLPTVAIGKHDLSFESHSIQDLDALADVELLWDVRGEGAKTQQREPC